MIEGGDEFKDANLIQMFRSWAQSLTTTSVPATAPAVIRLLWLLFWVWVFVLEWLKKMRDTAIPRSRLPFRGEFRDASGSCQRANQTEADASNNDAMGHQPTFPAAQSMSAIGCKADILLRAKSVANDPKRTWQELLLSA